MSTMSKSVVMIDGVEVSVVAAKIRTITAAADPLLAAFGAAFPSCGGMTVEALSFEDIRATGYHLWEINHDESPGGSVHLEYDAPDAQRIVLVSASARRRYVLRLGQPTEARVEFGERGSAAAAAQVLRYLAEDLAAVEADPDEHECPPGAKLFSRDVPLIEVEYVAGPPDAYGLAPIRMERVSIERARALADELDALGRLTSAAAQAEQNELQELRDRVAAFEHAQQAAIRHAHRVS